jgi:beta-glucosidase
MESFEISPIAHFILGTEWSDFSAKLTEGDTADDHNLSLSISIRNTGGRDGNEVVQIYARDCLSSLRRPFKELKGFRKIYVPAGEIRTISIDLDKLAFCMYDDKRACWIIEKGKFEFLACRSARAEDEQARVEVEMQVDYSWTGL